MEKEDNSSPSPSHAIGKNLTDFWQNSTGVQGIAVTGTETNNQISNQIRDISPTSLWNL